MKTWVLAGLVAALAYGVYSLPLKYLSSDRYMKAPLELVALGLALGVLVTGGVFAWLRGGMPMLATPTMWRGLLLGAAAGSIWLIGTLTVTAAFRDPATNMSQLIPLVNANTLVAVLGGLLVFRELANGADLIKILVGSVLMMIGGYVLSS
ncbi:hypothetical protein JJB07_13850 [Tumebacillus sp. ITR2]|uniref:EamA domain-containing protein n=1 Tax=Tumebacillus amylolyticus TaxID=2801339 RepID=A0ABS1JBV5_9BACL|nr:hypothetical protein [Tumebacillus amylolyticus]MBL0387720.1 hypothetical protein [Tumebacillus amylolyticus]